MNTDTILATPSIEAISPIFSADPKGPRGVTFHTHAQGRANLERVGTRIAGDRDKLVGLYVVENPEPDHNNDAPQFGRVIALVRVLKMPKGRTTADYPSGVQHFWRGNIVDRWPFGWPCECVFFSAHGGPKLRDLVGGNYGDFAHQFLYGPIDLRRMPMLRKQLLTEVRHEVARNPASQLKVF